MYELDVSVRAEEDFDRIISYISQKLAAPLAAAAFADEVYDCYGQLENNPFIYEECHDSRLRREGYRRAVIKNYILLYKIYEDMNLVVVHRFFYGGQDYGNLI
jgi:plasmid stabilization system protein ParE